MEFKKVKELSEKIVNRAMEEIEKDMITKNACDMADMKILSMAIDNIKDSYEIESMQKHKDEYMKMEVAEVKTEDYKRSLRDKTEFDECVEEIIVRHGKEKAMSSMLLLFSDLMEDLSVLQPKIYDNVITKMKALK